MSPPPRPFLSLVLVLSTSAGGAAVVASGERVVAGGEPDEAPGRLGRGLGGLREAGGVWVGIRVQERAVGVTVFTHTDTIVEKN